MNRISQNTEAEQSRAALTDALGDTASGDYAALRRIYIATSAKLFGICLRICGDRQAAEDVLQEVYITIWKRSGSFDPARASPITWLATIARNRAIDWRRAQGKLTTAPMDAADRVADSAALASDVISDQQEATRLHGCLDELEPHTSEAIRSAFLDGLTYAELAERAAVPLGTMKSWIRRGLQRLKGCLGDG